MRTNGGACGPWMRWSKDQMMIDDDGGVMFNIACRLGTGTLWDAPRVFYCETPVSSVSRVMCNPELFICTNLLFDNTLVAFARAAQGYIQIRNIEDRTTEICCRKI